jgi:hemerythrin-like domain-containing protein
VTDPRALAERVRSACLQAASAAYEQAGISGLCGEGRWELALQAMKAVDVAPLLDTPLPDGPILKSEQRPMQRIEALRRLSSEHHSGLVIARRAREQAGASAGREAAWADLRQRFADELEPHFKLEERGLLPALRAAGEKMLVERTLDEHLRMRTLIATGGPDALTAFAEMLTDHIRFEEKELFETAQLALGAEELERIQALHDHESAPVCRT